jgi:prepilin-type processing-associated H-X9-DG protein
VDTRRHAGKSNYSFADGHVEKRALIQTYSPTNSIDAWNPLTAR